MVKQILLCSKLTPNDNKACLISVVQSSLSAVRRYPFREVVCVEIALYRNLCGGRLYLKGWIEGRGWGHFFLFYFFFL